MGLNEHGLDGHGAGLACSWIGMKLDWKLDLHQLYKGWMGIRLDGNGTG